MTLIVGSGIDRVENAGEKEHGDDQVYGRAAQENEDGSSQHKADGQGKGGASETIRQEGAGTQINEWLLAKCLFPTRLSIYVMCFQISDF